MNSFMCLCANHSHTEEKGRASIKTGFCFILFLYQKQIIPIVSFTNQPMMPSFRNTRFRSLMKSMYYSLFHSQLSRLPTYKSTVNKSTITPLHSTKKIVINSISSKYVVSKNFQRSSCWKDKIVLYHYSQSVWSSSSSLSVDLNDLMII